MENRVRRVFAVKYNRREFLRVVGAGAAFVALPGVVWGASKRDLPNIVYILADDMGYGDVGCLNKAGKIPTPNMDRLAAEGMVFTDAHSGSAVCTPTRYGVLTGRYCWRSRLKRGVLGGLSPALIEDGRMTVASLLKKRGYKTACVGKWHLGLGNDKKTDYSKPLRPGPNDVGFDYFFGIPASLDMAPYCYVENDKPTMAPTDTVKGSASPAFWRGGKVSPDFKHIEVNPTLTKRLSSSLLRQRADRRGRRFSFTFPWPHRIRRLCPIRNSSVRAASASMAISSARWTGPWGRL